MINNFGSKFPNRIRAMIKCEPQNCARAVELIQKRLTKHRVCNARGRANIYSSAPCSTDHCAHSHTNIKMPSMQQTWWQSTAAVPTGAESVIPTVTVQTANCPPPPYGHTPQCRLHAPAFCCRHAVTVHRLAQSLATDLKNSRRHNFSSQRSFSCCSFYLLFSKPNCL